LKHSLSAYLRKVRAGHSVVVYDRDVPIARIDRIEDGGASDDRLALLAAQGITRPPEAELSAKRLRHALSRPLARSVRLLDAVLEERREGR
jgi:antitoxin (DNA-binding transcriptional repressor) of toxin-antitoxin stability system